MSRYEYRTRRNLFNRHHSNPHKNFGAFEQEFTKRRKAQRTSRFLLILLGLIFLIMMAFYTAKADEKRTHQPPLKGEREVHFSSKIL